MPPGGVFIGVSSISVTFLFNPSTFPTVAFELWVRMPNTCLLNHAYHAVAFGLPVRLDRSVRMMSRALILPSLCDPMQGKALYTSVP
jgi:hypothetical protein